MATIEATLLYTFSTIAQTLAAAAAFLGAFALYRLQGLSMVLRETGDVLVGNFNLTARAEEAAAMERFDVLEAELTKAEQKYLTAEQRGEPLAFIGHGPFITLERFREHLRMRTVVLADFVHAVVSTGVAMLLSVVALISTPLIVRSLPIAIIVLLSGIVVLSVPLWLHVRFVRLALKQ